MRRLLTVTFLVLLCVSSAFAEETVKKVVKDTPKKLSDRNTAVMVDHQGADPAGIKLSFRLKELFNSASLFTLSQKDEPKITLLISSKPEFPSRPEVGSAVAVVWVYSESEGTLKFFLGRDVLLVSEQTAEGIAQMLAERTDGMAVKYSYLFEK